jgi:Raf kinase inhibitor-like YbhB/YbcL family protein
MNSVTHRVDAMPLCGLVLLILAGGTQLQAHPGHAPSERSRSERGWIDVVTGLEVRGTFVAASAEFVQVRRTDDSLVTLPLSRLGKSDQDWVASKQVQIRTFHQALGTSRRRAPLSDRQAVWDADAAEFVVADQLPMLLAQADRAGPGRIQAPEMAATFAAFVKTKTIRTRWDEQYFYVESKGMPDHRMMVGITAWQQQVPLPQAYFGENAWRIPLHPVPARNPVSTRNNFLRGAIALAANGIPIFNPLNNRGDDSYLFGELDEFGGHCGRADDYHYHIAPVHLQKQVGQGLPIAYALDGYPIYGYEEPDGSTVQGLDALNGHKDAQGRYHYHATKSYPYLNGGFYGEVTERGGQVDPQPRAEPIRPDLRPLRDAKITEFQEPRPGSFELTYQVNGKTGRVQYTLSDNGAVSFTFTDTHGKTTNETYSPRRRGPGGEDRRPPPRGGDNPRGGPPPRREDPPQQENARTTVPRPRSNLPQLVVTSSGVNDQGFLSSEFTCDGKSISPPVEWKGAPAGTKFFALSVWHVAPDQEKSYWVVYNIPATVTKLEKNSQGIGVAGINDKRRAEYDPMCSRGPGVKIYHVTVYALSAELSLAAGQESRANLLAAIKEITLAEGTLDFQYERK